MRLIRNRNYQSCEHIWSSPVI